MAQGTRKASKARVARLKAAAKTGEMPLSDGRNMTYKQLRKSKVTKKVAVKKKKKATRKVDEKVNRAKIAKDRKAQLAALRKEL